MKYREYDDYDFDKFYGDVNGTYVEEYYYIPRVETCYDTYTPHSDYDYYDWN